VEAVNDMSMTSFVLAVDIPSGLDGLTGKPSPVAVMADATVSFHAAKVGLAMPGAAEFTGNLYVGEIGIPRMVERAAPPESLLVTRKVFDLFPATAPDMHKGDAGHVLIVGGSPGLTGAPHLAALAALRGGAGLATAACPGAMSVEVKSGSPDIMTMPLGHSCQWDAEHAGYIANELPRFDSLLVGPGLGRSEGARKFLQALFELDLPPLILDADGLYWPATEPDLMAKLPKGSILTPHPGEMARLLDTDTASVQNNRLESAKALAARTGCIVVLKGAGTVIAEPGGHTLISPVSAPNLAVGGTGDVLAGLMAALVARGLEPAHAAALAVYWHAKTGETLGESHPCRGTLASEVANALPNTLEEYTAC
jgi:NAD(P)H-hydrate epimerase